MERFQFKVIACEVLTREICLAVGESPHSVDLEFTDKGAHNDSAKLRELIQSRIDLAESGNREYEAIILGFGLCGNALEGVAARKTKLIIPRAHDCCTLFLGDKKKFQEYFGDRPSTPFTSAGYMEHGGSLTRDSGDFAEQMGLKETYEDYVAMYGEESAQYLWDSLHTTRDSQSQEIVFIETPELSHLGYAEKCQEQAKEENKKFTKLEGSMSLLRNLILGNWKEEDYLTVNPGQKIKAVYDWEEIMGAMGQ